MYLSIVPALVRRHSLSSIRHVETRRGFSGGTILLPALANHLVAAGPRKVYECNGYHMERGNVLYNTVKSID